MVFQTHRRLIRLIVGVAVVASTLSCMGGGGSDRPSVKRLGDDVLVSGGSRTFTDSVPGDAILAGGDLSFSGATGGDYLGAGGQQAITGRIHGSLRAAGGEIHLAAAVDRNATITGGDIVLDSAAVIARNAYLFGGKIEINGTVREGILAAGGSIVLNGVVGRDVEISGGELRVGPRAQIAGNLRYRVPANKVHIDSAARISGTVTALPVGSRWGLRSLLWVLGILLAGTVVVALFPRFMAGASEILPERPVLSALFGLGWAILVPIVALIAAITFIGLPLALLAIPVYMIGLAIATIPFALWLGRLLLGARARPGRSGALVGYLIGALLLMIVGLIPVVGGFVTIIAACLGLGALLLEAQAVRTRQPA
jgi:hypothetical protein